MNKFLTLGISVFGVSIASAAWFGNGLPDYAQDASSMFYCVSTGTVLSQAGVSISSPTISLYNPSNSGKNLTVLDVGIDVMASPAAAAEFSLAYNVTPSSGVQVGTGGLGTVTPALIGKSSTTAIGVCSLQGILPAKPTIFRMLGGTTGASAIGGVLLTDQTQGKVVVPPGGLISIQSSSAAQLQSHILWREDSL